MMYEIRFIQEICMAGTKIKNKKRGGKHYEHKIEKDICMAYVFFINVT